MLKEAPAFWKMSLGITVETGLRYLFFAGLAWLLAYVWFRRRWLHRKIIASLPASTEVWREVRYSLLTLVIFGAVGAGTIWAGLRGYSQLYFKMNAHGWGWFAAGIVLAIFLHDTYFYWSHRLMHHPRLFRWFHRTHHLSHNPTPWAAYAFDPLEAVVQAGIFPLVTFVLPIHPFAFLIFMTWQITFNVLGHTGYEFHPRWLMDSFLGKLMNTPTNHVMHHEKLRGNYGLYFNFWDRLMRTNHEQYEERFREVTTRPKIS